MKHRARRMKHVYEYIDQKSRQAGERIDEARLVLRESLGADGGAAETAIRLDAAARCIKEARAVIQTKTALLGRKETE